MKIIQSPIFFRTVRKIRKNEKRILDNQIKRIVANPNIGIQKSGALKEIFVLKFKVNALQYLLAYRKNKDQIELIMIGPHENYYRDLQKYMD
ncbi:type II toxin-antitoxin system RelE/ParE family toxin [Fibrobacterota bacterium]